MSTEIIDIGRSVTCDICNGDYTDSNECGGIVFGSYGICPTCTVKMMPDIIKYNEGDRIAAICADGQSFADFIREHRGPEGNKITITTFDK